MPISPALPFDDEPTVDTASHRLGLPPSVIGGVAVLSVFGFFTTNPLLTVASIAILPVLIAIPWRPGEPPVLPFILSFQWLQATLRVFHANIEGVPVGELALYSQYAQFAEVEQAIWLSLLGLVVLAIGMRVTLGGLPPVDREALAEQARSFSIPRAFWLFLAVTLSTGVISGSVGYMSGLRQILGALEYVKWAAYFFLAYLIISRDEQKKYLLVAFAYEFITGIGFFSSFKEVIVVSVLAYFTARSTVTFSTVAKAIAVVVVVGIIGATWTVVKPEFRREIGVENRQGAVVSQEQQIQVLYRLISELDGAALAEGLTPLASRISYVDMFGYTLNFVPSVVPHEDGALWGATIKHVLTPRILFPQKPEIVNDSEITNRYTGLYVAGAESGTSISIGYMGESYIDFGPVFMFIPIFLVGIWRGLMYRFFITRRRYPLFGFAFVVGLFTTLYQLENATGKMFGGLTMRFIVLSLTFALFVPYAAEWLRGGRREDTEADEWEPESALLLPTDRAWT